MSSDNVIGLITARGGSKGLHRKNVLSAGGKPLIAWTIIAALDSSVINKVVLSSDDDEIIEIAEAWGCTVPFRRPPSLSSDTASSIDVVLHALEYLHEADYIVLLQPTSPLRTSAHIDAAFHLLKTTGSPSCVSVCVSSQSPYWMYQLSKDQTIHSIIPATPCVSRRQDLPHVYMLNGAIYIARVDWLKKTKSFVSDGCVGYVMNKQSSIDIDTAEDFELFRLHVEGSEYHAR